ncbi:TPA: hypothetical protein MJB77_25875 [Klebsiella pneumoniae]|nr:hypothetical protein [Klebsiella pneumoniae]
MKRTSIALAVMAGTLASVKSWSIAEIPHSLYTGNSYPVSGGKTGIAAARRAAKKRRRARNG